MSSGTIDASSLINASRVTISLIKITAMHFSQPSRFVALFDSPHDAAERLTTPIRNVHGIETGSVVFL